MSWMPINSTKSTLTVHILGAEAEHALLTNFRTSKSQRSFTGRVSQSVCAIHARDYIFTCMYIFLVNTLFLDKQNWKLYLSIHLTTYVSKSISEAQIYSICQTSYKHTYYICTVHVGSSWEQSHVHINLYNSLNVKFERWGIKAILYYATFICS